MSWFGLGGGGDKNDSNKKSSSYDTSFDSSSFDTSSSSSIGGGSNSGLGSSGGSSGVDLQQELVQLQQSAMVQAVMFKLTEMSFENCVTKPGPSLTSSEQSCINAVVKKYLDTSEFTTGRLRDQH